MHIVRVVVTMSTLLLLPGCYGIMPWEQRQPDDVLLDRIEARLASNACLAPLDRWERGYHFRNDWHSIRGALDPSRVIFRFRQAGVYGFRAGRRQDDPDEMALDHRQYRMAGGEYFVDTGRLELWSCGWNCGPGIPAGGSCG